MKASKDQVDRAKTKKILRIPALGEAHRQVGKDDGLIAVVKSPKGKWYVGLTALLAGFTQTRDHIRLKYVKKFTPTEGWNLPRGLPPARVVNDPGFEVFEDWHDIEPYLVRTSRLLGRLKEYNVHKPLGFDDIEPTALSKLAITFSPRGEPEIWTRTGFEQEALGCFAAYKTVLQRFLSELPGKGQMLEKIVEEVFEHPDFGFRVDPTLQTRDGGVDLVLRRRSGIVGEEKYVVQVKNQAAPVGQPEIGLVCFAAQQQKAQKAILVTSGAVAAGATAFAAASSPAVELIDGPRLAALLCPRLDSLATTLDWFLRWSRGELHQGTPPIPGL